VIQGLVNVPLPGTVLIAETREPLRKGGTRPTRRLAPRLLPPSTHVRGEILPRSARRGVVEERSTMDLYVHAYDEDLRGAVASLDRALGS
jgi:hypothetical protein